MLVLPVFGLVLVAMMVPMAVWLVTRGRRHLTRRYAWSLTIPTTVFVLMELDWMLSPERGASRTLLVIHGLSLGGWLVVCGLLFGWLVRSRLARSRKDRPEDP